MLELVHSHLGAHPWMNTALEFDGLSRRKNRSASGWTLFFLSRFHEDICRTIRSWLEHRVWNEYHACRAFWRWVQVPGKHVQWNDEAAAEFCDFSESMCLA